MTANTLYSDFILPNDKAEKLSYLQRYCQRIKNRI